MCVCVCGMSPWQLFGSVTVCPITKQEYGIRHVVPMITNYCIVYIFGVLCINTVQGF